MLARFTWLLAGGLFLFLASCQSQNVAIEPDLTPVELFQKAQESTTQRNYRQAMLFYENYLDRFPLADNPDQLDRTLWAEYEIAFLYHKLGQDRRSLELLQALLTTYDEATEPMPQAQRILAERVLQELERDRRESAGEQPA